MFVSLHLRMETSNDILFLALTQSREIYFVVDKINLSHLHRATDVVFLDYCCFLMIISSSLSLKYEDLFAVEIQQTDQNYNTPSAFLDVFLSNGLYFRHDLYSNMRAQQKVRALSYFNRDNRPFSNKRFEDVVHDVPVNFVDDCFTGSFLLNPPYTYSFNSELFASALYKACVAGKLDFFVVIYPHEGRSIRTNQLIDTIKPLALVDSDCFFMCSLTTKLDLGYRRYHDVFVYHKGSFHVEKLKNHFESIGHVRMFGNKND